jgi:hypothetical protein
MSEEIRELVGGEKITVTSTLGHEASGMDYTEGRSLLGNGYRLDLVSVPGATLLRREDGTEVARFSIWDATSKAIEQAAQEDRRRSTHESESEGIKPAGRVVRVQLHESEQQAGSKYGEVTGVKRR